MKNEQKNLSEALGAKLEKQKQEKVSHETTEEMKEKLTTMTEEQIITFKQIENAFITDMLETEEVKKKERKPNTIYTLKAFKEHINKLTTSKILTAEEITAIRKIHKTATERWIGLEME